MIGTIQSIKTIERNEWIAYQWINVTTHSDQDTQYLRAGMRPIEDASMAANDFDTWLDAVNAVRSNEKWAQ